MTDQWRSRTQAIHGGCSRSQFGENAEALFLTSGFRYRQAEDAADRFADRQDGYTYSGSVTRRCAASRNALR